MAVSKLKELKLARLAVARFQAEGYTIEANFNSYTQPPSIDGFTPDVVAKKGEEVVIIEVVTSDLFNEETRRKLQKLSVPQVNRKFIVITYESDYEMLKQKIHEWELYTDSILVSSI